MERPSKKDAKLRLFNLDSIRAFGKAVIPMGLNAYEKADRVRLERIVLFILIFLLVRLKKYVNVRNLSALLVGRVLAMVKIEVHHSLSLKDPRLHATPNTRVKTVVLHKTCHTRIHKESQKSSKI